METAMKQQEVCNDSIDFAENSYIFSPSIGKQRTIDGKTYFVRKVFRGGQDFETSMKRLASEHFYKNWR